MSSPEQVPGGHTTAPDALAAVYARMSGVLLSEGTVATALGLVTSLATDTITGSVSAGITLADAAGNRITSAATDPVVERLDRQQYDLGEGPCLTAWGDRTIVRIDDTVAETRWPGWCAGASEAGIRSMLSAPLVTAGEAIGAIKVYADRPGVYDDFTEHVLERFAGQASILVANLHTLESTQKLRDDLKAALRTRDRIAMARGILADREHLTPDQAQRQLITLARREGRSLVQVADALVHSVLPRTR
jgi:GAF domain-containing protein